MTRVLQIIQFKWIWLFYTKLFISEKSDLVTLDTFHKYCWQKKLAKNSFINEKSYQKVWISHYTICFIGFCVCDNMTPDFSHILNHFYFWHMLCLKNQHKNKERSGVCKVKNVSNFKSNLHSWHKIYKFKHVFWIIYRLKHFA